MKQSSRFLILALSMAVVSGCGNNDKDIAKVQPGQTQFLTQQDQQQQPQQMQPQYQQGPSGQPVIINNQPAQSSGTDGLVTGMILGHLMSGGSGGGGNGGGSSNTSTKTVVNNTTVIHQAAPAATSGYQQPAQQTQVAPQAPVQKTYAGWGSPSSKPATVAAPAPKQYSSWGTSSPAKTTSSYSSRSYGGKR